MIIPDLWQGYMYKKTALPFLNVFCHTSDMQNFTEVFPIQC